MDITAKNRNFKEEETMSFRDVRLPWEKGEPPELPERKSWDRFFMDLAKTVGKQSTCLKKQVGAVLVKDRRILATGYNGAPSGIPHCRVCVREEENTKDYSKCPAIHAEVNCITLCARFGIPAEGSTLYVEYFPCLHCVGVLINAGIKEIVYELPAVDDLALPMALQAGIKVRRLDSPKENTENDKYR